jgi:hypothetical protein
MSVEKNNSSAEKISHQLAEKAEERIAVHTDTFEVSQDAVGGELSANYWRDWRLLGAATVCPASFKVMVTTYTPAGLCSRYHKL